MTEARPALCVPFERFSFASVSTYNAHSNITVNSQEGIDLRHRSSLGVADKPRRRGPGRAHDHLVWSPSRPR